MLKLKECPICEEMKPLSDYYFCNTYKRYLTKCKSCYRKAKNEYYSKNRKKILVQAKEYFQTEAGKDVMNRASKKARKKYPEKWAARAKAKYWEKTGKFAKLACEYCGNFLSEIHHPDYSKPLEVWWLCKKHHLMADRKELVLYD